MFEMIKGKRVLITGGSSAIGSAIAKLFADYGALVGIHYRQNRKEAEKVLVYVQKKTGKAELFQGDLIDYAFQRELVKTFVGRFGGIDVLVNNAGGYYQHRNFAELDEKAWDDAYALNVRAPFMLMREAFRSMRAQQWGRIINISTTAINYVGASSLHYTSAKAALDTLTRGFAREGAKHNILVNSIRCGVIDTPMHTKLEGYTEEDFRKRVALIPLKRMGTPLDVARMALFLSSECGDFVTGQIISVAGGD